MYPCIVDFSALQEDRYTHPHHSRRCSGSPTTVDFHYHSTDCGGNGILSTASTVVVTVVGIPTTALTVVGSSAFAVSGN
jgi:hypothetical protein